MHNCDLTAKGQFNLPSPPTIATDITAIKNNTLMIALKYSQCKMKRCKSFFRVDSIRAKILLIDIGILIIHHSSITLIK